MGEMREIRWTWESSCSNARVAYMSMDGRVSIADMIKYMQEVAPDVDLEDIEVNFGTVKWTRSANADEIAERNEWRQRQDERLERWERETLKRLTEKYKDK